MAYCGYIWILAFLGVSLLIGGSLILKNSNNAKYWWHNRKSKNGMAHESWLFPSRGSLWQVVMLQCYLEGGCRWKVRFFPMVIAVYRFSCTKSHLIWMLAQLKSLMHVNVHMYTPVWKALFKLATATEAYRNMILTEELFLGLM